MPVKNISALQADCEQNCSSAADRRHVWLVRTQCLTSAAPCLCPHPYSLITALADPKTRFCRSLANRQPGAPPYSRQLVDTKALNHRTRTAARVLGLAPACGCFRAPYPCPQDAPSSPAPFPEKTGMSRQDAQRIS